MPAIKLRRGLVLKTGIVVLRRLKNTGRKLFNASGRVFVNLGTRRAPPCLKQIAVFSKRRLFQHGVPGEGRRKASRLEQANFFLSCCALDERSRVNIQIRDTIGQQPSPLFSPFGPSIKKLSIRIPFASDSSWWPGTARQLTQSLESSSLVASISDFLCCSPRSSGRHAHLHCTYFLNVENVAGVVGKANNRVTVATCLLTRDKWQKQKKEEKEEEGRKERKKEEERKRERWGQKKYRRMHRKRVKGGSRRGKRTKGEEENTEEEGSWWWKERARTRARGAKIQSAARPFG
ncbi:hypothetical protein K0M31_003055 [Melipona bicolor]|uniref:Uncharacterized protein n=1 Tax=Melipona bicolor TaxID=60889 RepID=A0AA40G0A4_9HYME|nr:hypothetical protein K0M31_003055 [Melipona bicolor]